MCSTWFETHLFAIRTTIWSQRHALNSEIHPPIQRCFDESVSGSKSATPDWLSFFSSHPHTPSPPKKITLTPLLVNSRVYWSIFILFKYMTPVYTQSCTACSIVIIPIYHVKKKRERAPFSSGLPKVACEWAAEGRTAARRALKKEGSRLFPPRLGNLHSPEGSQRANCWKDETRYYSSQNICLENLVVPRPAGEAKTYNSKNIQILLFLTSDRTF